MNARKGFPATPETETWKAARIGLEVAVVDHNAHLIATVCGHVDDEESWRKGRKLAAAADLFRALKNLVEDFDRTVWTKDPMLIEARAALAKAEGTVTP